MGIPTLFVPGNLEATEFSESQEALDKFKPIDYIMKWFETNMSLNESAMNKVLILLSSTGSGKSTVIPPEFYHRFFEKTRKNICCTQPRVLTGIEIPKTIVPYHTKEALTKSGYGGRKELKMGDNIGYQTGPISKKPVRGIIYMTIGVLTQQLTFMSDEDFMKKYSIIIIDEAHERSLGTDITLYLMKRFIEKHYKNLDCPFLVVMSATFDPKKFCDYLLSSADVKKRYKNIIKVKGLTFPIVEHFLEYDATNMYESIVEKVIEIHQNEADFQPATDTKSKKLKEDAKKTDDPTYFRDVLIFVPGIGDIIKLKRKLNKLNTDHEFFKKYPIAPLELSGETVGGQTQEYKNAVHKDIGEINVEIVQFDKGKMKISLKRPVRRVIIGTNVAETGITINTLKYVVDSGLHKSNEFNPNFCVGTLITKPITQGMYKQRRGRVGRLAPGVCYAIYTKDTFNAMRVDQFPDIIKDDVTLDLLNLIIKEVDIENVSNGSNLHSLFAVDNVLSTNVESIISEFEKTINKTDVNIYNLDLLDLPSADSLHYSMEKLFTLGAINRNSVPTVLGFIVSKFRFINIESIRMILSGYAWNVSVLDLINMAACLQYNRTDILPDNLAANYKTARDKGKFTLYRELQLEKYAQIKTDLMIADDFIQYLLIFNEFQYKLNKINLSESRVNIAGLDDKVEVADDTVTGGKKSNKQNKKYMNKSNKTWHKNDKRSGDKIKKQTVIDQIKEWCEMQGLNYRTLTEIADLRDSIINTMCMIGLNPFHNWDLGIRSLILNSDTEKIGYIKNLKMCIFEGFKMNIAVWNPVEKKYVTRKSHISLEMTSEYTMSKADIYKYGDNNPKFVIYNTILYLPDAITNMYVPKINSISVMDGYIPLDINFDAIV